MAEMDVMAASPSGGSGPSSQEQPRVRVEFPETWLWSESNAGYHLTPDIIYAAQFTSPSQCLILGLGCIWRQFFNPKFISW